MIIVGIEIKTSTTQIQAFNLYETRKLGQTKLIAISEGGCTFLYHVNLIFILQGNIQYKKLSLTERFGLWTISSLFVDRFWKFFTVSPPRI